MTMVSPVSFYWCLVHRTFHAMVLQAACGAVFLIIPGGLRRRRVDRLPMTVENSTIDDEASSGQPVPSDGNAIPLESRAFVRAMQ
ncbi:MAG: hypothetical protein ACM3SS_12045 [Rhodospirillaceae bacterium]